MSPTVRRHSSTLRHGREGGHPRRAATTAVSALRPAFAILPTRPGRDDPATRATGSKGVEPEWGKATPPSDELYAATHIHDAHLQRHSSLTHLTESLHQGLKWLYCHEAPKALIREPI